MRWATGVALRNRDASAGTASGKFSLTNRVEYILAVVCATNALNDETNLLGLPTPIYALLDGNNVPNSPAWEASQY
jgi:hypothetical protein